MSNVTPDGPEPASAETAELRQRWLVALLEWDAVRAQLPDIPATYLNAVAALRQQGQTDHAERVLGEAVRRFAHEPALAIEYARAAVARQDWEAALARWQYVRTSFPQLPGGYLRCGSLLRNELKRPDEADKVMEVAAAKFPANLEVWSEYALIAITRNDRPAATQRYKTITERFPASANAWRWYNTLLREARKFDEADAVVADALVRFPDNIDLLVDWAWVAQSRNDWETSLVRWAAVRNANPNVAASYWLAGSTLMNIFSRFDEADQLLSEGVARFPDNVGMAIDHAHVAERRGDMAEAVQRWQSLAERFPDNATITVNAGRVAAAAAADAPSPS